MIVPAAFPTFLSQRFEVRDFLSLEAISQRRLNLDSLGGARPLATTWYIAQASVNYLEAICFKYFFHCTLCY